MLRDLRSRIRGWFSVEDADERIEGSGEAITSPQHRRSRAAEQELERLHETHDAGRHDEP